MESKYEAVLVMEGGPNDGQRIPLLAPTTSIGRYSRNDVSVAEEEVSRSHAEIVDGAQGYRVRDLDSTNGTFVNDENIGQEERLLKDGDRIRFGVANVSLLFYCESSITRQVTVSVTSAHRVVENQHELPAGASHENDGQAAGGSSHEAHQLAEEVELYEGSARLVLKVAESGDMGLVLDFARQIRDNADLRVLRMLNEPGGAVHIWIGIRQPIALRQLLAEVGGVVDVSPTLGRDLSIGAADAPLTVSLSKKDLGSSRSSDWAPCVNCSELLEPGTTQCPRCRKTQA